MRFSTFSKSVVIRFSRDSERGKTMSVNLQMDIESPRNPGAITSMFVSLSRWRIEALIICTQMLCSFCWMTGKGVSIEIELESEKRAEVEFARAVGVMAGADGE